MPCTRTARPSRSKPANVMVTAELELKLIDFGLARLLEHRPGSFRTASGMVLGSLAYSAPEAVMGQVATAASDLWSLGVVAFELFTGERPFVEPSRVALVAAIVEHRAGGRTVDGGQLDAERSDLRRAAHSPTRTSLVSGRPGSRPPVRSRPPRMRTPLSDKKMLAGLRSWCTTPAACAAPTAANTGKSTRAASSTTACRASADARAAQLRASPSPRPVRRRRSRSRRALAGCRRVRRRRQRAPRARMSRGRPNGFQEL